MGRERGSLFNALLNRKSECLGVVLEEFPGYRQGDIVFVSNGRKAGTLRVALPLTEQESEKGILGDRSWLVVLDAPANRIKIIMDQDESIPVAANDLDSLFN